MEAKDLEVLNKIDSLMREGFKPLNPIVRRYRNLKRGIRNILYYFPVIWKDRDWDHIFIYRILATKLEKIIEYRRNDPTYMQSVGDWKVNRKLLECAILARRLSGTTDFEFAKMQNNKLSNLYDELIGIDYLEYLNGEMQNSEYLRVLRNTKKLQESIEKHHKDRLFLLLSKHIDKFWD